MFLQHAIVLALAVVCLAIVVRQAVQTLRLRKSGFGSCCSRGCSTDAARPRTQFIPVESLSRRR